MPALSLITQTQYDWKTLDRRGRLRRQEVVAEPDAEAVVWLSPPVRTHEYVYDPLPPLALAVTGGLACPGSLNRER